MLGKLADGFDAGEVAQGFEKLAEFAGVAIVMAAAARIGVGSASFDGLSLVLQFKAPLRAVQDRMVMING